MLCRTTQCLLLPALFALANCKFRYDIPEYTENGWKLPDWKYPPFLGTNARNIVDSMGHGSGYISNLNSLIYPFKKANCIISIDFFKQIDIPGVSSPIVVCMMKPVRFPNGAL